MSLLKPLVDHAKIEYNGIFDLRGMFKLIASWAFERDMEKNEVKSTEHELASGKSIDYEIYYTKRISDYTIYVFKIHVMCSDVNKVEIVKDRKKTKKDNGKILIYIDSFLQSDSENKWDERPILVFIRTIFEKYIYKIYTEKFERHAIALTHELINLIERHLNMYRHPRLIKKVPYF